MNRSEEVVDGTLKHPFTLIAAGGTGSGKTRWIRTLLERGTDFIDPSPERICWYYGEFQPDYEVLQRTLSNIEFIQGLPTEEEIQAMNTNLRHVIVIDDLMSELTSGGDKFVYERKPSS